MSKVYVIQNQMHYDSSVERHVPRFDMTPAKEHGELKFLLSPTAAPFITPTIIRELRENLEGITPDDYLLLVGNPVLIGLSVAVASEFTKQIKFLQWNGKAGKYIVIEADLEVYDNF